MSTEDKKRVGLALGGGVARGMAHVGVLEVLEGAGIPIDVVSGTSAGAILGASYCAGLPLDQIRAAGLGTRWWNLASFAVPPRRGLFNFARLEDWLEAQVGRLDIRDLATPLIVVATNLDDGTAVWLSEGPLGRAVRASCSVPGAISPVTWNGYNLVDGALVDNLPVAAARHLGADYVIGVDLFEPEFERRWGPLGPTSVALEMLIRQAGGGVSSADCLITPNLSGWSYLHFSKAAEFMDLGRQAALEVLPQLRQDLSQLGIV